MGGGIVCCVFLPVRGSRCSLPAISVKPKTSSSSRYASSPVSLVTFAP